MAHRRSPWGSITEVSRGRQYTLRYMTNTPEGRKRKTETVYGTYSQATMRLAELRVAHSDDAPCPTVGQAYEAWYLPRIQARRERGELADNTFRYYTRIWERCAGPRWSEVPLDAVRPLDVQAWLDTLVKGDATLSLTVLRAVERLALQYEVIQAGKFSLDYVMPGNAYVRTRRTLSLAEARDALSRLRGHGLEAAFIVACFGGARTAEAAGVMCSEVYALEAAGVRFAAVPIVRQATSSAAPTARLKNKQSRRTALVPEPYGERLLEIAGEKAGEGFEWLTHRPDGSPASRSSVGDAWRRAGIGLPFANLRPSWRTFAQMEWGVPADVLELLMGHKLPGVTGAHYMRPTVEQLAEQFAPAYAAFLAG